MNRTDEPEASALPINEVQLLLAEKRTSLSTLRTGIAILALPLSVLSLLIATSKYYSLAGVLELVVPLALINLGLVVLGAHLVLRGLAQVHRQDKRIRAIKASHRSLDPLLD